MLDYAVGNDTERSRRNSYVRTYKYSDTRRARTKQGRKTGEMQKKKKGARRRGARFGLAAAAFGYTSLRAFMLSCSDHSEAAKRDGGL